MLRPAAPLLLLAAFVSADDPLLPVPAGPSLGVQPMTDPALTPQHSQPAATTIDPPSAAPLTSPSQPVYSSAPMHSSGPVYSGDAAYSGDATYAADPFVGRAAPLPMAAPAAGCACNSGTSYSAGALAAPATMPAYSAGYAGFGLDAGLGYDALGYGGGAGYTGAFAAGMHVRHPYYSYRRPWYANGPMSQNITIAW